MPRRLALAVLIALAAAPPGPVLAARYRARIPVPRTATPVKPVAPAAADRPIATAPPRVGEGAPFGGLLGSSEMGARTRLGEPDIARVEGQGALWTYRLPDCALFVFFRGPQGQPLKVSGAASGPRRRGQAPLPVEGCIAQAVGAQAAASARP
jgi:hypothetical protein